MECWEDNSEVQQFMEDQGYTNIHEVLEYYELRLFEILSSLGKKQFTFNVQSTYINITIDLVGHTHTHTHTDTLTCLHNGNFMYTHKNVRTKTLTRLCVRNVDR